VAALNLVPLPGRSSNTLSKHPLSVCQRSIAGKIRMPILCMRVLQADFEHALVLHGQKGKRTIGDPSLTEMQRKTLLSI